MYVNLWDTLYSCLKTYCSGMLGLMVTILTETIKQRKIGTVPNEKFLSLDYKIILVEKSVQFTCMKYI